jgi:rhodanese-related sulfurtransferase
VDRDSIDLVTFPGTPTVPIGDVPAELSAGIVLLDVREPDEWEQGHAPGAVHIPMGDVPARVGDLNLDAELYVICRQGGRSARVVDYLNQIGFEAVNVDGGMVAWQMAGRPLVAEGEHEATIF